MDTSNSSVTTEVGQDGTQEIVQAVEAQVVPAEDYKNLEAFSTKNRQALIETAKRLVEKDKNELNFISDVKVRDKVVKELYGYDSFEEMTVVEGTDFSTSDDSNNEDELSFLKKKIRKIEFTQSQKELETAIAAYKKENPSFFASGDSESELRSKLKLITGEMDVSERIKLAGKLAFVNPIDPTTAAYKVMASGNVSSGGGGASAEKTKTDKEKNSEAIMQFLKIKKS